MRTLGRLLFWEYPRESWQWWIIVVLILTFIFATPPRVFKDQPQPARIVMFYDHYELDTNSLNNVPEAEWPAQATKLVNQRFKSQVTIDRVERQFDEADEVIGYVAFKKT